MGLGLETREGHVLVLEQALSDQADGQEGLVIDTVEFDGLEAVLEEVLGLDHQGLESGRLPHNDHIVLLDVLGFLGGLGLFDGGDRSGLDLVIEVFVYLSGTHLMWKV